MYIRSAVVADAPEIARIHISAWQVGYKGIMPNDFLNSLCVEERSKQWHMALSKKSPGINLVGGRDESIEGFCVYGPSRDNDMAGKDVGELVALNIDPDCWGYGLGTSFVKHVISDSKKRNWNSLTLWVIEQNHMARKLYEAQGFTLEGSEKIDSKLTGHNIHEFRYILYL